jgi:hypothetical protein
VLPPSLHLLLGRPPRVALSLPRPCSPFLLPSFASATIARAHGRPPRILSLLPAPACTHSTAPGLKTRPMAAPWSCLLIHALLFHGILLSRAQCLIGLPPWPQLTVDSCRDRRSTPIQYSYGTTTTHWCSPAHSISIYRVQALSPTARASPSSAAAQPHRRRTTTEPLSPHQGYQQHHIIQQKLLSSSFTALRHPSHRNDLAAVTPSPVSLYLRRTRSSDPPQPQLTLTRASPHRPETSQPLPRHPRPPEHRLRRSPPPPATCFCRAAATGRPHSILSSHRCARTL